LGAIAAPPNPDRRACRLGDRHSEKGSRQVEKDQGDDTASEMRNTKARLLQAACDAAGGPQAFAARLEVSEAMLRKYLSGAFQMPDPLLLRAMDLLIEERERFFEAKPKERPGPDGGADS